jgi:hypothetical protein
MRPSRSLLAYAIACLAIPAFGASAGAWERLPELPHLADEMSARPHHRVLVRGLRLGQIQITFENTRWTDLEQRLGPLKMRRQGDGGETQDWTCFTVTTPAGQHQVWLDGGELQGGEYADGVTAQAGAPWPIRECPVVDPGRGAVALDNGVWIGTSKSEVIQRLGRPTAMLAGSFIYDFEAPVRDRNGDGAIVGRLIFQFRGHRVHRLQANKDTSY